jgi:uncharacterized damage-inducible protein DinB
MASSEMERIVDQLERAFDGQAWHGPPVMKIVRGISTGEASARLLPDTHTIWELVNHITSWKRIVARRVAGKVVKVTPAQDWPRPKGTWAGAISELRRAHRDLLKAVRQIPEARLSTKVPGKGYNHYVLLHGAVQHDLYHAGQIALLKKGLRS